MKRMGNFNWAEFVNQTLEVAELFKKNGDIEMYKEMKDTANKVLDYIVYKNHLANGKKEKKQ